MMRWVVILAGVAVLFGGCSRTAAPAGNREAPAANRETAEVLPIRVSGEGVEASEPAVARDASGAIFVVYVEHSDKKADVFLQKLDASGKAAGDKVRVNPNLGEAKAWQGDPPTIAVGRDNTIYIGWTRNSTEKDLKGNDLLLSASLDGGRTFGEPARVNDDAKPASHGMHSLAIDKTGRIYLAWLDERNVHSQPHMMNMAGAAMHHEEAAEPNSEVFYSYSTDGGKTFAANRKIASDVCPCCKTTLLAADDGTVYAAWRQVLRHDHRHIAVASSSDGGDSFSEGVIVSDDNWQIHACPVSGAALAADGAKTLDVVWYTAGEAGQAGVYFARSSDGGKSFGPRILVSNEAGGGTPVLLERDGRSTAVFQALDGGTFTAKWSGTPASSLNITKTAKASVPAAANGVSAFVSEGKVWVVMSEQ